MRYENLLTLPRTSSCKSTSSNYMNSNSSYVLYDPSSDDHHHHHGTVSHRGATSVGAIAIHRLYRTGSAIFVLLRTFITIITIPIIIPTCHWLALPTPHAFTPSLGRKVTGTLFGNRRGHVSFSVQDDSRSQPVLIIELAVSTSELVREMSTGLVRIALECDKEKMAAKVARGRRKGLKLFSEPMWTMYCNGRKCGYAPARECTASDLHVLNTVQSVSIGAGVIPVVDDGKMGGAGEGELLYMRARFERVVGNRDSEAFYMMNPDGSGGPELSIFLLRV